MKWPRRNSIPHLTKAELAISTAIGAVEEIGCDPLLTEAVILLSDAKNKVADYVDDCHPETAQINI